MEKMVMHFEELTPELQSLAGGKGGMLARLYRSGYPVPEGLVVLPTAFREDTLNREARNEILLLVDRMRKKPPSRAIRREILRFKRRFRSSLLCRGI